jgi:hypothetical protein
MRVINQPEETKKIENIESLVQENLKLTKELNEKVKKINRYIFWQKVWGFIEFVLIMIPFILAIIYLPPYIKKAYNLYEQIISALPKSSTTNTLQNIEGIIKQLQGISNQFNLEQLKELKK